MTGKNSCLHCLVLDLVERYQQFYRDEPLRNIADEMMMAAAQFIVNNNLDVQGMIIQRLTLPLKDKRH